MKVKNGLNWRDSMSIMIIGSDIVGCALAAKIQNSGFEVSILGMEEHKRQFKQNPTILENNNEKLKEQLKIVTLEDIMKNKDEQPEAMFIALKAHQTIEILKQLENLIPINIPLISIQNGLIIEDISQLTKFNNLFGAVLGFYLIKGEKNEIKQTNEGNITFGKFTTEEDRSIPENIKELLTNIAPLSISNNIRRDIWMNALIHSIIEPICAIGNMPVGEILREKACVFLALWSWREFLEVLNRLNIRLVPLHEQFSSDILYSYDLYSYFRAKEVIRKMLEPMKDVTVPMVHDIQENKKTEIDYLTGRVNLIGKQLGVEMPINEMLVQTINDLENNNAKAGKGLLLKLYRKAIIEYF